MSNLLQAGRPSHCPASANLRRCLFVAVVCATALLVAPAASADVVDETRLVTDKNAYPTPAIAKPDYMMPITDPVFGTRIIRITDPGQPIPNPTGDPSLDGVVWGDVARHNYSSVQSWNVDESLLAIGKGTKGSLFLDGRTYEPLFNRHWMGGDVRWHPIDPEILIFVDGKSQTVGHYLPRPHNFPLTRTLTGYSTIEWGGKGKANPSLDGTKIPIRAQRDSDGIWVGFVYDIENDTKSVEIELAAFATPETTEAGIIPDFRMSPSGGTVFVSGCIVGHLDPRCHAKVILDALSGEELWRELSYHLPGHGDSMVDENGEEWLVGLAKSGDFAGHIIRRNWRTGVIVVLADIYGTHTSARNDRDGREVVLSTIWRASGQTLENEIIGIRTDGSGKIERYAHVHRAASGYYDEAHGMPSPDGTRILFASNWDDPEGTVATYVVELPTKSKNDPDPDPDPTPDPDPIPEDTTPPDVDFNNPASGSTVNRRSVLEIQIDATDNDVLSTTELYINGSLRVTFTGNGPFVYDWRVGGKNGKTYTLSAVASDKSGNANTRTIEVVAR